MKEPMAFWSGSYSGGAGTNSVLLPLTLTDTAFALGGSMHSSSGLYRTTH